MRSPSRLIPLLIVGILSFLPSNATAAQRPIERGHPKPPFGQSYRAVCGPAALGAVRCMALVITSKPSTPGLQAVPMVSLTPLGYGPADLQDAYGTVSESATQGSTQTVAVVEAGGDSHAESDLATYRSTYGLSPCTTANGCFRKVDQRGGTGYPPDDAGWSSETSLDLDAVSAICPNCHILLVEADDAYYWNEGAAVNEAVALGATQVSNSYSGGQFPGETSFNSYYTHPGVTITASSGDNGYVTGFPATSPSVTAVGGTSLTRVPATPRGWAERTWTGAGSGCSLYEAKPAWQSDGGCANRTVADVSMDADPATGAAVYSSADGGWTVFGGTSLSAPLVAAYDALIGSAAASPQYPYTHVSSYYDITSGGNGSCGGSYLCTAGVGYDGPTGVGTPHGAGLHRAPTVSTGTAGSVGPTTATLNGTVNPNGSATSYSFQYGTSTAYGSSTPTTPVGSDSNAHNVSASLASLSGSTTYHFRIVATNGWGTRYGYDNVFTTGAPPPPPGNTVPPHVIASSHDVGTVVSASAGTWTGLPTAYGYQWRRCMPSGGGGCTPSDITGATSPTYTLSSADVGGIVRVLVRAQNANGWSAWVGSDNSVGPVTAPVPSNTIAPHVTGNGQLGSTLSVSTGTWTASPTAYAYQWVRCLYISGGGCTPSTITGAIDSTYTVTSSDLYGLVWATVKAQNSNGWSTAINSDNYVTTSAPPVPSNATRPHVSGTATVGATDTAATGTWTNSPDAYDIQWIDCMPAAAGGCTPSQVGAGPTYTVADSDLNGTLYVRVRAHNTGGWSAFSVSDNSIGPIGASGGSQSSGVGTATPAPTPPAIRQLRITPGAFRAARRGRGLAGRTGARVSFKLSAAAYIDFTVERAQPGHMVGRRCVPGISHAHEHRDCTTYTALRGHFGYPKSGYAPAGAGAFRFTGRLADATLKPSTYRLAAVATTPKGMKSSVVRAAFTVIR